MTQAILGAEDDDVGVVSWPEWRFRACLDKRKTRHRLSAFSFWNTFSFTIARGTRRLGRYALVERRSVCPNAIMATLMGRASQAAGCLRRLLHGTFGPCKNNGEGVSRLPDLQPKKLFRTWAPFSREKAKAKISPTQTISFMRCKVLQEDPHTHMMGDGSTASKSLQQFSRS
ncbi:hypothetical protein HBI12_158810 [Parastagonospora nodorum]|nr:hypothetical protein HBI12_158810 [Parastagonospora nodorum]